MGSVWRQINVIVMKAIHLRKIQPSYVNRVVIIVLMELARSQMSANVAMIWK